jgi:hypothetical protein
VIRQEGGKGIIAALRREICVAMNEKKAGEGGPTYLSESGDLHDVDTLEGHDAARQGQNNQGRRGGGRSVIRHWEGGWTKHGTLSFSAPFHNV